MSGCPCCGALACSGLDEIARLMAERDALDVALGDGWVPVGERLPDGPEWRLVCTLSQCLVAHYADKTWTDAQEWPVDVTHWRNLPASPKE